MKKILLSLAVILAVGGVVWGVTGAFYNDAETSTGNIFTAGSIDLKVDHTLQTYNGLPCVENCVEINGNLIANGGFETPDVPSGGYAIYPTGALTSWNVESGDGLEIQDNADGAPHGGNQLAELDSTNPSVISQVITTVPGGKYRLKFWYSPRPNRPAGDNTIGAIVQVVSDSSILVNDTIGASSAGGSNTTWQELTYNFIAVDTSTKIKFSDLGTANTYGGYLDDVSVRALECTNNLPGGVCSLWGEKDLGPGDTFFSFDDVKPADWGTNVISLHVSSNDAYACLIVGDKNDQENTIYDPETEAGDSTTPQGELSNYINVFTWGDDGDGVYEPTGESSLGSGPLSSLSSIMSMDSVNHQFLVSTTTKNIGLVWCAGTLTVNPTSGVFTCDGAGMLNDAQSDSFSASLTAYAEQVRNNSAFSCADVTLPTQGGDTSPAGPETLNLGTVVGEGDLTLNLGDFAIVAKDAITDANPSLSSVTGNVVINPTAGSAITGLSCTSVTGAGKIYSSGGYTGGYNSNVSCAVTAPVLALAVRSAMEAAYIDAADRTGPDGTDLYGGNLGGQTFAPGLYKWTTGVTIPTDVTLSGGANDVWIFQIAGDLSLASAMKVKLIGGALAKNVFWQVGGPTGATLGTTSEFNGTILSAKQVVLQSGAILNGRAWAQSQVTLAGNAVTKP